MIKVFVNDRTQNILHPFHILCQYLSIDIKYIDIAQKFENSVSENV